MGCSDMCAKKSKFESPGVGSWCLGIAIQLVVAQLCGYIGYLSIPMAEVIKNISGFTGESVGYVIYFYASIIHYLFAVATAVFVFLGTMISSCFMIVVSILSIFNSIFCSVTIVASGIFLTAHAKAVGQSLGKILGLDFWNPHDVIFAEFNSTYLLLAGALCAGLLVVQARAHAVKNDANPAEAQLWIPSVALAFFIGVIFAIGGAGTGQTAGLSAVWIILGVIVSITMGIAQCCSTPTIFNIFVCAAFCALAVLALITILMSAGFYKSTFQAIASGKIANIEDIMSFTVMNGGSWTLIAICSAMAVLVGSFFSASYALRSIFLVGSGKD